eukprot:10996092-Ditylum_brightwellii.AAC.1
MKLPIITIFTASISIRVYSAFNTVSSFTTQCSSIPHLSTQLKILKRICPNHHHHPKKNRVLAF